jgi:hypothetical protein
MNNESTSGSTQWAVLASVWDVHCSSLCQRGPLWRWHWSQLAGHCQAFIYEINIFKLSNTMGVCAALLSSLTWPSSLMRWVVAVNNEVGAGHCQWWGGRWPSLTMRWDVAVIDKVGHSCCQPWHGMWLSLTLMWDVAVIDLDVGRGHCQPQVRMWDTVFSLHSQYHCHHWKVGQCVWASAKGCCQKVLPPGRACNKNGQRV